MSITGPGEFLTYFNSVHERTMTAVASIPPERIDWTFQEGKFTIGDLVRHIATANRYIFVETAAGGPSRYSGCGKELAPAYDDVLRFAGKMHDECAAIISGFSPDYWEQKCTTPAGASLRVWKWLRLMIEHEIHHRGQIYTYLSLMDAPRPRIYGLTSEQVRDLSVPLS